MNVTDDQGRFARGTGTGSNIGPAVSFTFARACPAVAHVSGDTPPTLSFAVFCKGRGTGMMA